MTNHAFPKLNRRRNPTVRRIVAGAIVSVTFAASLTLTFTSLAATIFNVRVAGEPAVTEVHTFRKDPVRIVNSVGVMLDKDDHISVTPINGGENSNVVVYKSGKATVDVDGEERQVDTGRTVAETIADSGIVLAQGDAVDVDLASFAYDGMEINIERAYDVYVQDGEETYTYRTTGCKAGEAVYALGLTLDEEDELDVAPETELSDGDTVQVLRCTYIERTELESIDYGATLVDDSSLFEGQSRIVSEGVNGVQEVVYREKYLGTTCVKSEPIKKTVIIEPVDAVKAVGTRVFSVAGKTPVSNLPLPEGFTLDENGVPTSYQSYFDGVATAYYGGGLTASGVPAAVGYVAVDPKVIPYGTPLWIVSLDGEYVYGYAIAADTGGFVKGGWADMDLYMNTASECWNFGIRDVRIYIL
jgi:uncharacterized protein YabE (DUF348 family)/3D (Asp-Asp-Asp) domain-containing protein